MAVSQSSLSGKIVTNLGEAPAGAARTTQKAFADAVAKAVVDELKANLVVKVTIPIIDVTTAGSATAQTGATNAPVNVTGTVE